MVTWTINSEKLRTVFVNTQGKTDLPEVALALDSLRTYSPISFFQQSTVNVHRGV